MKQGKPATPENAYREVAALIATLRTTEERLEELTGSQVDTVTDLAGRTYVLRRAQEQLRLKEVEKQAAILNALYAHVALLDPQGVIVSVNDGWKNFGQANTYQAPGYGLGLNYLEVCDRAAGNHAAEAPLVAAGIRAVLEGREKNFMMEYPCHAPTQPRWFLLRVTPLAMGGALGAVVMHVNITERKLAEISLQESERDQRQLARELEGEKLRLVEAQAVAKVGSWETDLATLRVNWSRETQRIFETDPATFQPTHESFLQLVHPDDRAKVDAAFRASLGSPADFSLEHRLQFPHGHIKFIEERWRTVRDAGGTPQRAVGTCHDITERKRAEQETRFNELRYRSLVEATSAMVWSTPASGEFEVEQPGWAAVTGQTFADYRGWGWLNAVHPDDRAETARVWSAAVASHSVYRVEHRLLNRDKSYRNMLVRAVPVLGESDAILMWTGIHTDITERKQIEEQLRQSQKMEAFGQLAGGVAHDFNNILTVIQGHAGLAEAKGDAPAHVIDSLRQISLAATRAAALTRQLLTFSHKQVLELRDLDVNEVVSNMTKMLRRILREDVSMELKQTSQPQIVHADGGMIEQILMNLTVNARDAMPEGGKVLIKVDRVEFTAEMAAQQPLARPGSFVHLSVADTGTGIPPDVLPRIFEPFFTTKEVGQGTGLGLATVYGIVQQHLGWIEVKSEMGHGTTFHIYLPRLADVLMAAVPEAPVIAPAGGAETILLVEDEAAVQFLVEAVLTRQGYNVLTAATGAQAVAVWQQYRTGISLLLTDLVMPDGMSGKELGRRLSAEQPGLRIIYMSGYSAEIAGKDFPLKDGVNFLPKPFSGTKLLTAVRTNLDARHSTRPFPTVKG